MTPQEDIDLLLRATTRLAKEFLAKGGIIPFGAIIASNREIQLLMPQGWKKNSTRDELEAYWYAELKKQAGANGSKIACFCADVGTPVESGEHVRAVNVYIEHAQAEAANYFYPYSQNPNSEVELGQPTKVEAEHQVFTKERNSAPGHA